MGLPTTQSAVKVSDRILSHLERAAVFMRRWNNDPAFQRRAAQYDDMAAHSMGLAYKAVQLWRKEGRQALAIHPGLVEETRMATSDKVPPEILRALPYLNPLVIYPDPPAFESWTTQGHSGQGSSERMRLLGFLTYGVNLPVSRMGEDTYPLTLTHDADATSFGMYLVFEVTDETGRVLTLEENMMSLPLTGKPQTLKEIGSAMAGRYHWSADMSQRDPDRSRQFLIDVLEVVLGSLFYLCSTTLEAEEVPRKFVARMHPGVARKPISLYKIGWQTGAAVSRYRHAVATGQIPTEMRAGREQDPQHRRAHFKWVWYGPGKSAKRWTFVSPYWTHRERLGDMGVNTARAVK